MYEGKNIHYSSFDKKPLCSFSTKVCNQHRLNGYAFCVRHILEDPTAPFRRCSYVAKSSKQTCTQAIPKHEEREYCNNHMQVLGMLPRKEKKLKKEKNTENSSTDVKIPFQDRVKSRFNITKLQNDIGSHVNHTDDPDDPYAFPDPCGDTKIVTTVVQPTTPSSAGDSPSSVNQVLAKSPGDSCSSSSSIAKFYPELAEKLEKIKPKNDALKLSKDKGKDKSSRTMNSLQTRIAQNRIKSKRRSTQESSSQSQSPLHCFGKSPLHQGSLNDLYSGFGNHIDFEKSQKTPPAYNSHFDASPTEPHKSANVPGIELKRPPPSYFRQPFDRIASATSVNSPVISVEEKSISSMTSPSTTQIVNHCVPMDVPHGTPIQSLPGISSRIPLPNTLNLDIPPSSVLPNIAAYLSAVQAKNPYLTGLPSHLLPHMNLQHSSVPLINLNSPTATGNLTPNAVEKSAVAQSIPLTVNSSRPLPQPPPLLSPSGLANVFPTVCGGSTTTTSVTFTGATQQIRPPPPPYSSAVAHALNKPAVASTATTNKYSKPLLNVIPTVSMSLMSAKPEKLKHVLSESEVEKKIRSQTAKKYYNAYLKRKIYDHSLLKAGIDSSSEDSSDDERKDLLPWQPKWFCASSDEEGMDEEEDQNDVIRTTKLALLRSRLRRHCSQSRRAFKGNVGHLTSSTSITKSLIDAARESVTPTVCAINEKIHVQQPKIYRYKRRGLDRRQCLYKNDEEVQCVNPVVPCANHCLKHIMYNIDQQLFDYCTAKTADNVQCCTPVIDNTHELPLCLKHAREVEESYRYEEEEIKPKRPRKKTKPSALTRPPKKGKKKKNQRKLAALQMAMEEATVTSEAAEAPGDVDMDQSSGSEESDEGEVTQVKDESSVVISDSNDQNCKPSSPVSVPVQIPIPIQLVQTTPTSVPQQPKVDQLKDVDKNLLVELPDSVLAANLPADLNLNKGLELPLEQASRLLEEQDFQDVLNKIPDETFDIFSGKNGEPTKEEMDELERHLAAANMDLSFAQQSISSTTDYDEQIRILASILTNQSPSLQTNMGNDILNGAIDEHPQENIGAVGSGLSTNLNTPTGLSYQQTQMPQYHQTNPNNQVSPLHHSAVINNMAVAAGHGQIHQLGPAQQVGSPGPIHNQQMSPGNNFHVNQIRSVQHGSPLGQVPQHGSPVGQVQHHGSPVGQVQHQGSPVSQIPHHGSPIGQTQLHGSPINHVQVRSLQSPSTSNAGSPIPVQNAVTQQTTSVHNIQGTGHLLKTGNVLPSTNNLIAHNPVLIRGSHPSIIQHNLQKSGHQMNSVPSSGHHVSSVPSSLHSVRLNSVQNSVNTLTLVNSLGHLTNVLHSTPHQQINTALKTNAHHTINLPHSVLPVNDHSKQSNLGHPTDAVLQAGKVLFSVPSNVQNSSVLQSHTIAASSGHNTERVQSSTHNVSSYQNNQQPQVASKPVSGGENFGTKKIPVLQQTKLTSVSANKIQSTGITTAGAASRVAWQANFDGLHYQNGFPSHSAQFVNDLNSGKYVMTSAHGIQNCTDSHLLQNITQSLVTAPENQVSNITGVNSQRIQLSAQTGTGS